MNTAACHSIAHSAARVAELDDAALSSLSTALARLHRCNTLGEVMDAFQAIPLPRNGHRLHGCADYYAVRILGAAYCLKVCKDCGHILHIDANTCHVCAYTDAAEG